MKQKANRINLIEKKTQHELMNINIYFDELFLYK